MSQKSSSGDTIWSPDRPHDGLPHLPPAVELETKNVLKACLPARAALAELKQAAALIPNPAMLANTLPVLEARASAEIENIVTTTDRLFRQLGSSAPPDEPTRQALSSRHALFDGLASLTERPLCTRTAEIVCSRVLERTVRVRTVPGTALARAASGRIVYTPPVGEDRLRGLLANWERFLHDAVDIDPLIRMAAAHYQFEAIHPFTDGNGRTGRVLNVLFLVEQGLIPLPILQLSRAINASRTDYYERLLAVTRDDAWEPWLIYMLRCVEETATWTTRLIASIRELGEATAAHVRRRLPKLYTRELVDLLLEQPYCRISNLVDSGLVGRQAASRHLKALASIDVVREEQHGREKLFVNPRLMSLLASDSAEATPFPE